MVWILVALCVGSGFGSLGYLTQEDVLREQNAQRTGGPIVP
jgi:hypothetical protein